MSLGLLLFQQNIRLAWEETRAGLEDASGRKLKTPEEADVFRLLGLKFTPPPARVDAGSLVRL